MISSISSLPVPPQVFAWVVLPILIFLSRIADVSIGPVEVVFTIVPWRDVASVVELVKKFNPRAFYSIEEVDAVERGVFPAHRQWHPFSFLGPFRPFRKG